MWGQDGGFGGSGGGFMAGSTDSPATQEKSGKGRRSQNIMPVTVKQLLDCQEDAFKLEGFEAHVVTIVGLVKAVEATTTKMSMYIDDQTGTIECVSYVGTDGDGTSDTTMLCEGSYGRVVGALRSMKGNKYLIIFKCEALTDLNELTCHLLEVLQNGTKLKKIRTAEETKPALGALDNTFSNSMIKPSGTAAGGTGTAGSGIPGFSQNQNLIHRIISSCQDESGMHKDQVYAAAKSTMTLKEVMDILDFLSNEGHVFSTIDDDHYKSTDPSFY